MEKNYSQLVEENQRYYPFFPGGFSNHRSMVLYCLKRMGASNDVLSLQASEDHWQWLKRRFDFFFEPVAHSKSRVTRDNWMEYVGNNSYYPDYLEWLLTEEIWNNTELLNELSNLLRHQIDADLFHPVIRYAMGVDDKDTAEQGISLAYWLVSANKNTKDSQQCNDSIHNNIESLLSDLTISADFITLHYLTSFIAIKSLPRSQQQVLMPHYKFLLKRYTDGRIKGNNTDRLSRVEFDKLKTEAKNIAFASADPHVVKSIYAILELQNYGEFQGAWGALNKMMVTSY